MREQLYAAALLAGVSVTNLGLAADGGSSTTVGGQAFFDFGHISQQSNGVDVPTTGTGFDVKRFYLVADHKFDDMWSANITTDAQFTSTSGGVNEVFIKKLYLQGKFNDAFVAHVGAYTSPWAPFVEDLNGYRYIEKTQTDRLGFAQTADWGLNATGTLGNKVATYSLSVVNGAGSKNPTRTKDVDVEGRIGFTPVTGLTLAAGFYSGHLGQITTANSNFASNTATRWDVAIGYTVAGFRVGGEYFDAKNYKTANPTTGVLSGPAGVVVATSATGAVISDEASGGSVWASYNFSDQMSVFARYDTAKPSKNVVSSLKDTYAHVGFAYKPIKALDVAVVYKYEKVDNGSLGVSSADGNASYTIGGTSVTNGGKFSEFGVYAHYKF